MGTFLFQPVCRKFWFNFFPGAVLTFLSRLVSHWFFLNGHGIHLNEQFLLVRNQRGNKNVGKNWRSGLRRVQKCVGRERYRNKSGRWQFKVDNPLTVTILDTLIRSCRNQLNATAFNYNLKSFILKFSFVCLGFYLVGVCSRVFRVAVKIYVFI